MITQQQTKIKQEIEINENHINNFQLETTTGTKKMKEKFHKKAVEERNAYIEKELKKFKDYQKQVYIELTDYIKSVFPQDKSAQYQQEEEQVLKLLRVVSFVNDKISLEMKLGYAHILYKFSPRTESSLDTINKYLLDFIDKMSKAKIILTKDDFAYSPYTLSYMTTFFENKNQENLNDIMQAYFKEIYWECPELIMHLKRNLIAIIKKNYQKLKEYNIEVGNQLLTKYGLTKDNAESIYQQKRLELDIKKSKDEFYNLQKFLGKQRNIDDYTLGAPLRSKSFNQLVMKETYPELTEEEKKYFDAESITLSRNIEILKQYYRYESIIKDIIQRYKKKEEAKTKYEAKEKEITTEEKTREKLYKDYQKANGIGFLARKNEAKAKEIKVQIKEQINKLNKLYEELEELEIDIKIANNLNEGSSIYDALITSLSSYSYLEKVMVEKFDDVDTDFKLENYVAEYLEFIFNPNADFLHKITVLLDYDIAEVFSEKYALLGVNISKDEVTSDAIDTAIQTIDVVALINNIKQSNMTIEEMKLIYDIKMINYKLEEEEVL